jgi:cytochrome c oxidase subunit II
VRPALAVVAVVTVMAGCGGESQVDRGEGIARDVGCMSCHSTGTDARLGPGWGGIWGTERLLDDGTSVVVDDAYLRRAITDPDGEIVAGWDPIMPRLALSDAELDDVVAYLRDVSGG